MKLKKIMHHMFLSCLKATRLIEKKLHEKLTLKEKIQLSAHKAMCDACTNYDKQANFMHRALHHAATPETKNVDFKALENDILARIENLEK